MTTINYPLAARMGAIEESPFLAVIRAVQKVERSGRQVHDLSRGEPDSETPEIVKLAGIEAIETGNTRYTAMDGTEALQAAIAAKMLRDNDLNYGPNQITVTAGGTQAIFNAMMATVGPGDEVILPAPFFPPYLSAIRLAGATPVLVETFPETSFALTAAALEKALTPKTRWVVLISPCNPSGSVIEADELTAIAEVLRGYPDVMVWSDDIYESIIYDGRKFRNIINVAPDFFDRTVILNGVSKAYSMTGWRLGYLCGPAPLIEAATQVAANSTFSVNAISQAAAVVALTADQGTIDEQCREYQARRDIVYEGLAAIPSMSIVRPKGSFYAFPGCQGFMGKSAPNGRKLETDLDFVLYILETAGVALLPGSAFGLAGYARFSFAANQTVLRDAVTRIASACTELN